MDDIFYLSISGTVSKKDDSVFTEEDQDSLNLAIIELLESRNLEAFLYIRPGKS